MKLGILATALAVAVAPAAEASIISVFGPLSSAGTGPSIIAAPVHALDDIVTNTGMQGFNEAQGVVTSVAHAHDSGVIAAGTLVDSHMIFLNSAGSGLLTHFSTRWTFSGIILGVMSDSGGTLEAASTFELGAPGTNYTATFGGSGPAAPFPARGLERNGGCAGTTDGYLILGASLCVDMRVTEPGDWIRVVTAVVPTSPPQVPVPAALPLFATALAGLGFAGLRRRRRDRT